MGMYGDWLRVSPAELERAEDDLLAGVDQADLVREGIYPAVWDRPDQLPWVVRHLPYVRAYFTAAAAAGDAVVCWIG